MIFIEKSGGYIYVLRTINSFNMSFCIVPDSFSCDTPYTEGQNLQDEYRKLVKPVPLRQQCTWQEQEALPRSSSWKRTWYRVVFRQIKSAHVTRSVHVKWQTFLTFMSSTESTATPAIPTSPTATGLSEL